MKVFIVFLALLFVNVNMIVFQNDLSVYRAAQSSLKEAAEDCAYAASLYLDDGAYADGYLKFDCDEGIRYMEYRIDEYRKKAAKRRMGNISYTAYFFDECGTCTIYRDGSRSEILNDIIYPYSLVSDGGYREAVEGPCVKVEVSADTSDSFRQDFIRTGNTVRSSAYGVKS